MRISGWSSDVCSSDLQDGEGLFLKVDKRGGASWFLRLQRDGKRHDIGLGSAKLLTLAEARETSRGLRKAVKVERRDVLAERKDEAAAKVTFREAARQYHAENRSEEHTSELQSLMRISYAVFCLKKKQSKT